MDLEEQYAKICLDVLSKIKPNAKDKSIVEAIYQDISSKIKEILTKNNIEVEITLSGSFSRDTWLAKVKDIDIFLILPYDSKYKPEEIISLIREQLDLSWEKRHAEHPYLYAKTNEIALEIIPGYQYKPNRKIRSAVDRSPAHKKFIIKNLPIGSNDEVRLLKQFMEGIGVYGAEIKIQGFSGYLVELLIIHFDGKFLEVLKHANSLLKSPIIFGKDIAIPEEFKNDALVVIDPVDANRNVASAVSKESLTRFIAAAEQFLLQPKIEFFYPRELVITNKILTEIKETTIKFTAIIHKLPKIVDDVLWGQIRKFELGLFGFLTSHGINPLKIESITNNKKIITIILSEHNSTPEKVWVLGPPIGVASSDKFLEKYQNKSTNIYGPEIINGRWQVLQKMEKVRIDTLIEKAISEKLVTTPSHLSLNVAKIKIMLQDDFMKDLSTDHKTIASLYYMIKGKPKYLY